jgi:hypothetical protein
MGVGSWACRCARRVNLSDQKDLTRSCQMRVGVAQGLASRRRPGVQQEGRLFRQPVLRLDTYKCSLEYDLTLLRAPGPPVLTRLRLLMTSVLSEMGRGRPCSFKKRPQALQRTDPVSSRRQSGVVLVVQFWHTG